MRYISHAAERAGRDNVAVRSVELLARVVLGCFQIQYELHEFDFSLARR